MHIAISGWFAGRRDAGTGQYIDHLLPYLAGTGGTRLSLLRPRGAAPVEMPDVATVEVRVPRLPRNVAKLYWEQVSVPRAARQIGADVLWVPHWAAPWWQPVPTVVTIHDLIPLLLPAYRGGMLNRAYTRLVAQTAKRAAMVIAVSAAGKRDIVAHLGIDPARVQVVYHGPNQQAAAAPTPEDMARVAGRYQLPARYFLYLGGFDVRKNVSGIVTAYARYLEAGGDRNVQLVIAGKLPDEDTPFAPDPRRVADALALGEQIRFIGWVDEQDKRALYAGAVAYLFPSVYEGFGMMLLEAMAAGTPVITSDSRHRAGVAQQ
jgi:glycosyltransferase involved in cell wall biosynthesis